MPVEVASVEDLAVLQSQIAALGTDQMPVEVKDALVLVLNWIIAEVSKE